MSKAQLRAWIGLGSNLEDPLAQVSTALQELRLLPDTTLAARSSLYRSDPVGPPGQPDYINAVAALDTRLEPEALLDALQAIEQMHQRVRKIHWGPRTLDLDLLLYGDQVISTPRLTVPHAYMTERNFVLWPLAELEPELILPDGRPLNTLLQHCPLGTLEKISL
ncbi:2-amino-4-hydroxy-6-hydroxymethyldihydropteridine diphosphokinase [Marinobacterium iners]|jgi:2-amino-4-hydroxy-6-hydroxymethyldihydropteridine diphosphokinase|uniref:2-amino-4-hydroxy-6- hydroxymethyldihydropteridine diphosphokinase n=1 Tax=Marinobacterium iners TaxID=48076 RepID=UPI001A8C94A0|nr:2-amino-4-hydroxy-6-hydroxymethyldihydropteridine diphosphokinase [Marinobacterium iners]QSR36599.1 2-amino-4-hydroxy-6-hydroxymethyldihydropteridine diphosphokinase [Marinobacterium iners]